MAKTRGCSRGCLAKSGEGYNADILGSVSVAPTIYGRYRSDIYRIRAPIPIEPSLGHEVKSFHGQRELSKT